MVFLKDLQLNTGMRCAKYMLLIVSFMFAITAILLVMVGTTIQAIFGDFRQFVDDHFLSPPSLIVAIGFILLVVAFLGAYGAIKESVLLINMYGVCLFLVFILEVTVSIVAFVMQGQVREMLVRTLNDSLIEYEHSDYIESAVDFMQSGLGCCGVYSPDDWKNNYHLANSNSTVSDDMILIPPSCCKQYSDNLLECEENYIDGCLPRMHFIISQSTMLIATGATTVSFVQLLGSICAFMLAKTLRRNKSLREARRWQLQQNLGVLISNNKAATPPNSPVTAYSQLEKGEEPLYVDINKLNYEPIKDYTPNSPSVN